MRQPSTLRSTGPASGGARGWRTTPAFTVLCWVLIALSGCSQAPPTPKATAKAAGVALDPGQLGHIQLLTVAGKSYQPIVHATGTVDYDQHRAAEVLAPISGLVTGVTATLGDTVREGQVMARVASADYAHAIGAYRQALAAARSQRRLADQARDLLSHESISAKDAADAESSALAAESDRDSALGALRALGVPAATISAIQAGQPVHVEGGVIRAPISGTVVARGINPGQQLAAGNTPCFTIADLGHMWVEARLFGTDVQRVQPGNAASIELEDGGTTVTGKVITVSPAIDPATGAVTARIEAGNPHGALRKQMYVRVRIQSGRPQQGLVVPLAAVLRDADNRPYVYVEGGTGHFERRHVTLGYRTDDEVVADAGLAAGDRIVAEGGLFLRFMESE